jgi:hypothetical protein
VFERAVGVFDASRRTVADARVALLSGRAIGRSMKTLLVLI